MRRASQTVRFRSMVSHLNFKGKAVLDVGCGTGDFLSFLSMVDQWPKSYLGIDVLQEALEIGKRKFDGIKNVTFYQTKNYLNEIWEGNDIVVGIGLFSLMFIDDEERNYRLVVRWFEKMYNECREACGASFLSAYKWKTRLMEAVFKPERLFGSLKPKVERLIIDYSYAPHVFTIIGLKGETPWHRNVKLERTVDA
jgi:SAM-dependent methyltransferase